MKEDSTKFSVVIIGDEILSGKRQDKHFPFVLQTLQTLGLSLQAVRYLTDDRELIAKTLQQSRLAKEKVLCYGGIGATPDDHTRQAAAQAFEQPLVPHEEAQQIIRQRIATHNANDSDAENERRLLMGVFPQNAKLIPNPFNQIPGFFVEEHFFMPGFPVMAHPMTQWVLEQYYKDTFNRHVEKEKAMRAYGLRESSVGTLLEQLEQTYPEYKTFSLPTIKTDENGKSYIELGIKGTLLQAHLAAEEKKMAQVFSTLCADVRALGVEVEPLS